MILYLRAFPGDSVVKNPPANARDTGDLGLIPGLGSSPGGGHGLGWSLGTVFSGKGEEGAVGNQSGVLVQVWAGRLASRVMVEHRKVDPHSCLRVLVWGTVSPPPPVLIPRLSAGNESQSTGQDVSALLKSKEVSKARLKGAETANATVGTYISTFYHLSYHQIL